MRINARTVECARLKAGLLRRELSQKAGLCLQTVDNACRTGICGLKAARQIAQVLGLKLADILILDIEPDCAESAEADRAVRASA